MNFRNKDSCLAPLVLLLCFSFHFLTPFAADRISGNESLSGDQTIVSAGGNFVLGFFSPGNSTKFYVGMWYNRVSTKTFVWVANRDKPIRDKSTAELKIQGLNLVLIDGSKTQIWSTDLNLNMGSNSSDPLEAVLFDSGNFALGLSSNLVGASPKSPIWQSFDHPTHTWLPGTKIGMDNKKGKNQILTSWKNSEDPSPGLFSLELDPNGSSQYFILWNRTTRYWTSGPWNGKIFSLVPEMNVNYIYNFSYVSNENESYFTYWVYDPKIISRFIMDFSGQIKQETWLETTRQWNLFWAQPRQQCEVHDLCGSFGTCSQNDASPCDCLTGFRPVSEKDWGLGDFSGGCERRTPLTCGNNNNSMPEKEKRDRFISNSNMKLPDSPNLVQVGSSSECELACLSNCSCTAYAYDGGGCSTWTGKLLNVQQVSADDSSAKTLNVRVDKSEFHDGKKGKGALVGIIVGSILGAMAVFGIISFVLLRLRERRRLATATKAVEGTLVAFEYRDLQAATKNFSEKLGGGGFGSVFKGTLPETIIAVKKLESVSQGEKQFRTEVSTIGAIQHVNLVRLRGFCSEGAKKLLVYDYMPNRSLDAHLFPGKGSQVLDWKTRYQIALGTARGLAYLHEKCRDCIIHCDIKPENILLDAEFCPKVADFGLAKLMGRDFSRVLTTMRGTRGYLAPEWISGVAVTAKADVYSYGMMLFEFISGRRNGDATPKDSGSDGNSNSNGASYKFFPSWVASRVAEGADLIGLLDERLDGNADVDEVARVCRVACWCIQDEEFHRPSMGQVVQILEGVSLVGDAPVPRSLQVFADDHEHIIYFTDSGTTQSLRSRTTSSSAASSQVKSSPSSALFGSDKS